MSTQINCLSSMATRRILADLAHSFEQQTGIRVAVRSIGGVEAARLVRAGERTDIVVLASKPMERLEAEGHLVAGSCVGFARSGIAIAIRSGAPPPVISDEQSAKLAMLQAGKICYSTGPSGDHLKQLWARWGITALIAPRAIQAPPGVPVSTLIAQGDADMGFQQLSELLDTPGIDIIGQLPADIQAVTVFCAGISRMTTDIEQARALIAHFVAPEADAVKYKYGMEFR